MFDREERCEGSAGIAPEAYRGGGVEAGRLEPYDHLTTVDLEQDGGATRVRMTIAPMHDQIWTERLVAGRTNEIDNLVRLVDAS